jgi:pyruvate/2-oxoglutarate dehydrogenase complex dihydrolipoamide acyltransferase (E2) component
MKDVELVVPKLGMDTIEAAIKSWLVAENSRVDVGTPLVELETEKVDFVVDAEVAGVLTKIIEQEGSIVAVGGALGIIQTD